MTCVFFKNFFSFLSDNLKKISSYIRPESGHKKTGPENMASDIQFQYTYFLWTLWRFQIPRRGKGANLFTAEENCINTAQTTMQKSLHSLFFSSKPISKKEGFTYFLAKLLRIFFKRKSNIIKINLKSNVFEWK